MEKKELEALAEKHQKKADQDYRVYQETGITRYGSSYRKNEELADAFRTAAYAAEDHQALCSMRSQMYMFASKAKYAMREDLDEREKNDLAHTLLLDIVSYGQLMGLITRE